MRPVSRLAISGGLPKLIGAALSLIGNIKHEQYEKRTYGGGASDSPLTANMISSSVLFFKNRVNCAETVGIN